jgi:hypothetical protein
MTLGYLSQELTGLPPSFVCLGEFHLKLYLMLDYQQYMMLLCHSEKLRCVTQSRSDRKRVFTNYGKHITYMCVGPQPSRNSNTILDNPPFVDALPQCLWEQLVWLMKCAETSFPSFTDHCIISHLYHAKKLVPFKTFSSTVDKSSTFSSEFFGGIAFGLNVFLRCHTDCDEPNITI